MDTGTVTNRTYDGYLERSWDYLYKDIFNENDYNLTVVGTSLWMGLVFYILCAFLMFVDLTGRPKWMLRYKIQPGVNQPVEWAKLWKTFKVATFNQLVISGPWLAMIYYGHRYMGSSCRTEDLPSIGRIIRDLTVCVLVSEFLFYYSHRLFHWGPLYKRFHKIHHEWQAPASGVVAVYCHPVEMIICNLPQFTFGPIITGAHRFTTLLWYTRSIIETVVSHSGYHLPFNASPQFHDYHHLKFNCNYGGYGWLDWLHGTKKTFVGTIQETRDHMLLDTRSADEVHPDPKKKTKATKAE